MPKKLELSGLKFNRLTVLSENGKTNDGKIKWLCMCLCGNYTTVSSTELKNGGTKSCGCYASNLIIERNTTHGLSKMPEYGIWKGIKKRCYNKNETYYSHYGARGIKMCNEWFNSFEAFYNDMGCRPTVNHSIERRENNGNYEKSNCYWATKKEQSANKRNNRIIEFEGKSQILQYWANDLNIPVSTLHSALKVKSLSEVFEHFSK